jgi:hypothetical protein
LRVSGDASPDYLYMNKKLSILHYYKILLEILSIYFWGSQGSSPEYLKNFGVFLCF